MDDDPFGSYGLSVIRLEDRPVFDLHFSCCTHRLSDYTFANTFIWRDSIHLRWAVLHDCLCVFANGDGGLTMLFPPVGRGDFRAALRKSMAICGDYNTGVRYDLASRIEYVSEELLAMFPSDYQFEPMSGDYVYRTQRMIDLDGGDLSGKRQAKNRFVRRYTARTEPLTDTHVAECLDLLNTWQAQTGAEAAGDLNVCVKRSKETSATAEALSLHKELGLTGMVLYADDRLAGFTLGETLDGQTCSILIEKADRQYAGSAQYIFSEFCRQHWPHTEWCNVGDDWDVPSLAYTKESYRPARRLPKWVVRPTAPVYAPVPSLPADRLDRAGLADLDALTALEARCFQPSVALSRRNLRYLLQSPTVRTFVWRTDGKVIGDALVLLRRTRAGVTARLYSLAVDIDHRRRGHGRALLDNVLNILEAEGVATSILLEVSEKNTAAVGLYESAGFKKNRLLRDYYAPGEHAWKMRREFCRRPVTSATPERRGTETNDEIRTWPVGMTNQ